MNKIEEFYKDTGGVEYDKFDKKANKFTYYDMIGFADAYHSKQLNLADVRQQRELLIAFYENVINNELPLSNFSTHRVVDSFIKSNL